MWVKCRLQVSGWTRPIRQTRMPPSNCTDLGPKAKMASDFPCAGLSPGTLTQGYKDGALPLSIKVTACADAVACKACSPGLWKDVAISI